MSRKKNLFGLSILVVLALLLAACGGGNADNAGGNTGGNAAGNSGSSAASGDQPAGDAPADEVGTMPPIAADAQLDPASSSDAAVLAASEYLYDQLFRLEGGEVVGELAFDWSVSDDGLTYEVRLRANAVFSDGMPVSTDVIVANFNRWFDPANPLHGADSSVYAAWLEYFLGFRDQFDADEEPISLFDGIEKVDDLNFLLHLNQPIDNFVEILAMPQFSLLHPDILSAVGADYGTQGGLVVGSGPYVVGSWDAEGLLLVPSASYWGDAASGEVLFPAK